jgi:thiol-disulfide isomerase/thioredoxin
VACLSITFVGVLATPASSEERTADVILREIDSVRIPQYDRSRTSDRDYVRKMSEQRGKAIFRKADLIGELYRLDPNHPRLAELMPERWKARRIGDTKEIDEVLARTKDEALRREAAYEKADDLLRRAKVEFGDAMEAIEAFEKLAPKDKRGSKLLLYLADRISDEPDRQRALYQRVLDHDPDSPEAETARGILRQTDGIGKPFDLTFTDLISGSEISIKALKGKVVVVDFWATWCGPCIAEMPRMKKLYAEYKDKGVEFISISLDKPKEDGGLNALKEYVARNEMTWPQYYQGNYWDSEFSRSWGVNSIPRVFLIDQDGRLASTNARGKLEAMIPELLAKSKP